MIFRSKRKENTVLEAKTRENIVSTQILIVIMGVLTLFSQCSSSSNIRKLASSKTTSIQLLDGRTIIAEAKPGTFRSTQSIQEFSQQWYNLMLGWSSENSPVELENKLTIPANSYAASQMMSTSLQTTFLKEFDDLTKTIISAEKSSIKSAPKIRYVSEPKEIEKNTWTINIVADWIIFDSGQNKQLRAMTFNKTLTLKATTIPTETIAEENELQNLILSLRLNGLEITNIEEYEG